MDSNSFTKEVIEEQMTAWRINLERTRVQLKVAIAIEDKDMANRVTKEAERCIKALECLADQISVLEEGVANG